MNFLLLNRRYFVLKKGEIVCVYEIDPKEYRQFNNRYVGFK